MKYLVITAPLVIRIASDLESQSSYLPITTRNMSNMFP